jgi:hypothetical protein
MSLVKDIRRPYTPCGHKCTVKDCGQTCTNQDGHTATAGHSCGH